MKRNHILVFISIIAIAGAVGAAQAPRAGQESCAGARDLRLVNGRIVTMDKRNSIANEVTIRDGKFDAVGRSANARITPCTKTIDLRGHTAVPGLIDNHNHIVLLGMRPGYDTRLDTAFSVADIQAAIKERAKSVPSGAFITAMGG